VVVGLVLVAFQMHQSTEVIRVSQVNALTNGYATTELTLMGDSGAAALTTALTRPAELTEQQLYQFIVFNDAMITQLLNQWQAYRAGQVSEEDWAYARDGFTLIFGIPAARELWKVYQYGLPPELVRELDEEWKRRPGDRFSTTFVNALKAIHRLGTDGTPYREAPGSAR
jgi:hypothetical protein